RPWQLHIVIEPVLDWWSYAEPGVGKDLLNCRRHDMRSRMAQTVKAVVSLGRDVPRSERSILVAVYLFAHSRRLLYPFLCTHKPAAQCQPTESKGVPKVNKACGAIGKTA